MGLEINNLACKAGVVCSGSKHTILGNSALQIDKELGQGNKWFQGEEYNRFKIEEREREERKI